MFTVQTSYSISRICSVDSVAAIKVDCETIDGPPPPPPAGKPARMLIVSVSVLVRALVTSSVSVIVTVSVTTVGGVT